MLKEKIICLMGPTGVGKSKLAIELTKHLPCEIISVDSVMVYRGMDIGTAKPSQEELVFAPHRLIDICDPIESYSAGRFCKDVSREIKAIRAENKTPLLVGGTMLYFHALQQGLSALPEGSSKIREYLTEEAKQKGISSLYARLKEIDPIAALRIKANDLQRIQRALEIYELTGKSLSECLATNKAESLPYDFINVALLPDSKASLNERIGERFKMMLKGGLLGEVEALMRGWNLTSDLPAMRAVGYRQVYKYLKGELTYEKMEEQSIIATRQLTKRQMTWLRSWPNLKCFINSDADIVPCLQKFAY